MINHLFMCLHKLVAAVQLEIKAVKHVRCHSITVGGGALSRVDLPDLKHFFKQRVLESNLFLFPPQPPYKNCVQILLILSKNHLA